MHLLILSSLLAASDPGSGDWPMWGGTPDRNMISTMKGIPTAWDLQKKTNIKWVSTLGSQAYGNPTVAGGVVLVGTNNEGLKDPKVTGDKGVVMAFDATSGKFLWQAVFDKLSSGRANDWPYQGIASSPLIEGDRAYFTTNRAQVVCVELKTGKSIWSFDMMAKVGSYPHNLANASPAIHGDLLYVSTSNGRDESHDHVPSPKAPSLIALNKNTGQLAWAAGYPGEKILHGQWAAVAVGAIGGVVQVVSPQGDGWVRGYEAETGKQLWEFDSNPKDSVWPKTRNELISTPVIYKDRVYIANGQDPEHGEGPGHLYCIDATKRGDITQSGKVWQFDKIRRSMSTAAIWDGIVYYADFSGFLHALDAGTGKEYWTHDLLAAVWGSAMVIDGKIYVGDEDGDVVVLEAGKTKKQIAEMNMGSSVYCTPVAANGTLYIVNRNQLIAIAAK